MKRYLRNWGVSAIPILTLGFSALLKLSGSPQMTEQMYATLQFPKDAIFALGLLELVCVLIYVIPQTAVLGAILLTGYLGGAIASHYRIHDNFAPALALGVLVWFGLYLRDARLRELLPLTSASR
jgi:hypothetical protein